MSDYYQLPSGLWMKASDSTGPYARTAADTYTLVSAAKGQPADRSGTITTGGTAQQLMAANTARTGFSIMNLSTGDLWINGFGTAAASQPSMRIQPGYYFETPVNFGGTGAVSIFGATTGQAFCAREW